LLWEAPFKGSPSWNRQLTPVVYKGLVIYQFADARYTPDKTEDTIPWLFNHGMNPDYPSDHKPLVRAWDLNTGQEVWTRNFSEFGSGGDDAGLCLMDDTLYYTCFFGYAAKTRRGFPAANGVTAAIEPETGQVIWLTTQHSSYGGCALSAKDGKIYLGGYNSVGGVGEVDDRNSKTIQYVWCLDAQNGSLIWETRLPRGPSNSLIVNKKYLFAADQFKNTYLIDKETGELLGMREKGYRCTRFSMSGDYALGDNLDIRDMSGIKTTRLIASGPQVDTIECVGSVVSNGRIFYTAHGSGLMISRMAGEEAAAFTPVWKAQR